MVCRVGKRRLVTLSQGRYGAALAAASLIVGEAAGFALDFTSDTAVIRWPAQPASQYQGRLAKGLLTYTAPSPKMVYGPTGVLKHQNHNLLTYSGTLSDASWTKSNVTIVGQKVVESTGSASRQLAKAGFSAVSGLPYLVNVYAKADGRRYIQVSLDSGTFGASNTTWFDLVNGTVGTNGGSTQASITALGDGHYKCTYLRTASASAASVLYIGLSDADNGATYTGDGASGVIITGAEVKRAPVHEDAGWDAYVPTGAAASALLPLDYDPATLTPRGALIEEQRTNLLLYSEQLDNAAWQNLDLSSISPNAATAPDGNTTAEKLVPSTSSTEHMVRQTATITAGAFCAGSMFAAPAEYQMAAIRILDQAATGNGFTVIVNLTTGQYQTATSGEGIISHVLLERRAGGGVRFGIAGRTKSTTTTLICDFFVVAGTDPATAPLSYAGDGASGIYAWGLQCERGPNVGSYIPTGAAQVTRAADVISITTSAIPYNTAEGTLIGEGGPLHSPAGDLPTLGALDDGSTNNRIQLRRDGTGVAQLVVGAGGVVQASITITGSWTTGGARKLAAGFRAANFNVACNGVLGNLVTSGTVPTAVTSLMVGSIVGLAQLNGHVRKLAYIPRRLPDAELQRRTA